MGASLKYQTEVLIVECAECGGPIALANASALRNSHATFYCPSGHRNVFKGEIEAERLKKELEREKQRREMAERETAMERKRAELAEKKVARASKGVCTCCNRSFTNLRRHMETKHPKATT